MVSNIFSSTLIQGNSVKFPVPNLRTSQPTIFLTFLKSTPMLKPHFPWMMRFNLRVFPVSKAGGKPPLQPANRWTGHLFQYAFLGELKEVRNYGLGSLDIPIFCTSSFAPPRGCKKKSSKKHIKSDINIQVDSSSVFHGLPTSDKPRPPIMGILPPQCNPHPPHPKK